MVAIETINPHILLLAMVGVRTSETMQVRIQLGGASLLALIDSVSTHNFVSEEAAARTSLQLLPRSNMKVTVANGERVPCPGVYRATAFSIDGESSTDFFALPLAGYDVVLGTHWLASLGPILWDFGALTMSFWHRDHRVCWQGVPGPASPLYGHATTPTFFQTCWTSSAPSSPSPPACRTTIPGPLHQPRPGVLAGGRQTLPLPRLPQG